jgi:transposase
VKGQLEKPIKEQQKFIEPDVTKAAEKINAKVVAEITKQIKATEEQIKKIIEEDEALKKLYGIVASVKGIGFVTALYMIVTTNEFIDFKSPKQFACYSGVVPFEHSSGTSIKGKNRVSQMADKRSKTLLHMSAIAAISHKGELQDYYKRKVEEGKNKMSVINAVRNKLILRIFACVQRQEKYQEAYEHKKAA